MKVKDMSLTSSLGVLFGALIGSLLRAVVIFVCYNHLARVYSIPLGELTFITALVGSFLLAAIIGFFRK